MAAEPLASARLTESLSIGTRGASDISTVKVTIAPGTSTGWHSHDGPVVVAVHAGTATKYQATRGSCQKRVIEAGEAWFEPAGDVHVARNEGGTPLVLVATFVLPPNAESRRSRNAPTACRGVR